MKKFFKKIIIFIVFVVFLTPYSALSASLSISPNSTSLEVGQKVILQLLVSSDQTINAISSSISIPTSFFTIESVTKNNSVIDFWVSEPEFSPSEGLLNLEGVILSGYSTGSDNVITITLEAKRSGAGLIEIKKGEIFANDGQGTNITGILNNGSFVIKPAVSRSVNQDKTAGNVNEESKKYQIPQPPQILSYTLDGETFILISSHLQNSEILITFEAQNKEKMMVTGQTDATGNLELPVPELLKSGTYMVHAIVIDENIIHGPESNIIKVEIGNIVSDIDLRIKIGLLILIALILITLIKLFFSIKRNGNFKKVS